MPDLLETIEERIRPWISIHRGIRVDFRNFYPEPQSTTLVALICVKDNALTFLDRIPYSDTKKIGCDLEGALTEMQALVEQSALRAMRAIDNYIDGTLDG